MKRKKDYKPLRALTDRLFSLVTLLALSPAVIAAPKQKPLIGLSTNSPDYVEAIRKAGGVPVVIPAVYDSGEALDVVKSLDGILFTGGEDIDPAYYGEEILNATVKINHRRDTSEMLLIAAADKALIPLMGICRGSQILNVYFGGTLYQDLPTQHPSAILHKQKNPRTEPSHKVSVVSGTLISKMFPVDSVDVNSTHHQGVKDLAPCFKAAFISEDGVVEGYENDRVLAVQFHPEALVKGGSDYFLPLFKEFVRRAGAYRF